MGLLTFGLNVTLDGCCDHREMIADDELHDYFTQLITTLAESASGNASGRARTENASGRSSKSATGLTF